MSNELKVILFSAVLALQGCANMVACTTEISYEAGKMYYKPCKNQENLSADLGFDKDGKITTAKVSTTAITPEAVIAGVVALQMKLMDQMSALLTKLNAAGAGS